MEPLLLSHRFTLAVDYARSLHIECRKGTTIPFVAHLLGVASLVMGEHGQLSFPINEDMVIAALLHDAVEDHGGQPRLEDIRVNFGAEVARMVEGLSDTLVADACEKEPWETRKRAYLARLPGERPDVQLISAADKLYNARTMLDEFRTVGQEVWRRFNRGREQQIWYFRELLRVFESAGTNRIVAELERVVDELDRVTGPEAA